MSSRPYLADCGKCTLLWDPDNGQFDMEEHPDCPIHGWSDNAMEGVCEECARRGRKASCSPLCHNAMEGEVIDPWPAATKSDSPPGEKPPPSLET